jgi:hypothetical protein
MSTFDSLFKVLTLSISRGMWALDCLRCLPYHLAKKDDIGGSRGRGDLTTRCVSGGLKQTARPRR